MGRNGRCSRGLQPRIFICERMRQACNHSSCCGCSESFHPAATCTLHRANDHTQRCPFRWCHAICICMEHRKHQFLHFCFACCYHRILRHRHRCRRMCIRSSICIDPGKSFAKCCSCRSTTHLLR